MVRSVRLLAALSFPLWCLNCFAALGGDASSVQADVAHLQGRLHTSPGSSYVLHEIQTPSGTTVREYSSLTGKVFEVTWQGTFPPDLKQLLGSYFVPYQQALPASQPRSGRSPVVFEQANLVVQRVGHMRSFSGRAYLVDEIPAGVRQESIR